MGQPLGRPPTVEPTEGEEELTEGEEEPTEGGEESTEGEGGSTATAALRGHLGRPLRQLPAGEPTEGGEEHTEGVKEPTATTPMEAIIHPGERVDSGTLKRLAHTSLPLFRSTLRSKASKKLAPSMGKATAAFRKLHLNFWPLAVRVCLQLPQHKIGVWSAAMMAGPEAAAVDW